DSYSCGPLQRQGSFQPLAHGCDRTGLLLRMRRLEIFQKVPMPQLKHQQPPDTAGMDPSALKVLVQKLADTLWIEVPALHGAGFEQRGEHHFFQLISEPMHKWQGKSLLSPVQDFLRDTNSLRQLSQPIFP